MAIGAVLASAAVPAGLLVPLVTALFPSLAAVVVVVVVGVVSGVALAFANQDADQPNALAAAVLPLHMCLAASTPALGVCHAGLHVPGERTWYEVWARSAAAMHLPSHVGQPFPPSPKHNLEFK